MFVKNLKVPLLVANNYMVQALVRQMLLSRFRSARITKKPFFGIELDIVSGYSDIRAGQFDLKIRDLHRESRRIVHVLTLAAQQDQTAGFNSFRGRTEDK